MKNNIKSAAKALRKRAFDMTNAKPETIKKTMEKIDIIRDKLEKEEELVDIAEYMMLNNPDAAIDLACKKAKLNISAASKKEAIFLLKLFAPAFIEVLDIFRDVIVDEDTAVMLAELVANTFVRAASTINEVSNILEKMENKHGLDSRFECSDNLINELKSPKNRKAALNAIRVLFKDLKKLDIKVVMGKKTKAVRKLAPVKKGQKKRVFKQSELNH